ncbi:MAG TPA: hypothetical protein VMF70_01250 [Gemmatimonadales bacterium]|nr:hypothetical protein [Gemmatimonadales bacterium]
MRRAALLRALAVAAGAVLGCTNAGENHVTSLGSTGTVTGAVLLDANGSRVIDAGDDSLGHVKVRLVHSGGQDIGLTQTTAANGTFVFSAVPVGDYSLVLDTTTFADTLVLVRTDSQTFTVAPGATSRINVLAGRPLVTMAQARALPAGRKVFVVGVALASGTAFADTTTDIADTSGGLRVARARSAFAAGDSLRLLGTLGVRDSQPVLNDPTVFALGPGHLPTATGLTAAAAAAAAGGTLDAQLVSVSGVTVTDTARTPQSFVLTVADASGSLVVQLDQTADPAFTTVNLPGNFVPGSSFNLLGVLVPTGTGTWRLRPRSAVDASLIPPPVISIAAARLLPTGRTASVVGVALNGSTTFADSSVFIADTSGAIRLTRLRTTVTAGDSVRVRGTTASRNGQPTLDGGTTTALGRGFFPTAATLTTFVAAGAAGGARDAQMVIVNNATITDTSRTSTSFLLTVSDGSGPLQVQLDGTADAAFQPAQLPGKYVPGAKFNLLGVLAATGPGVWQLRPRSSADLTLIPPTPISIRAARLLGPGLTVTVIGTALNSSSTYSDTTVSLADTSGAIRLTRLRTTVAAGDSVRVQGVTSTRSGQPTLDGGTATALGRGLFPAAPTLTTAAAANAVGGTRDAQLVLVLNATVSATALVLGNYTMTVSDGSGNLTVVLDALGGFVVPGVYVVSNVFDIVGILVPTGSGTWTLKPRSPADLVKH